MDNAFLYLWRDSKNKKFYLGYHTGTTDDGYTHSSSVMESFKMDSKPTYMKRKILAYGTTDDIYELETKLLKKIRSSDKKKKYYNKSTNNISESRFENLEEKGMVHPFQVTKNKDFNDIKRISLYNNTIIIYKKNDVYWTRHKMRWLGNKSWKQVETSTKQKSMFDACVVATMLEHSDRTGKSCDYKTALNKVREELF